MTSLEANGNPHDKLFREVFQDKDAARDFIVNYLPAEVLSVMDMNTIEIAKDSFIADDLKESYSDLLYTVQMAGETGFVYDSRSRIDKARYHLDLAVELIRRGAAHWEIVNRMCAAFNRMREEWLDRHGFCPDGVDKYKIANRFDCDAPADLRRKSDILDQRLSALYYDHRWSEEGREETIKDQDDIWSMEAGFCLDEIKALLEFVENGRSLPRFRCEIEKHYRPGQWVRINNVREKVLAVDERNLTLRDHCGCIVGRGVNALNMTPEPDHIDDMDTPFERRRSFFDLNPGLRRLPDTYNPFRNRSEFILHT